jgi:hypothetical protein
MTSGPPGYPPPPQGPFYRPPAPPPPPGYTHAPYGFAPHTGAAPPISPIAPAVTEPRAVASLVLGILSLACGGLVLGVPAIFLGFGAKKQIERSGGGLGGGGLATAGIVTGITGTVASFLFVVGMAIAIATGARASSTARGHHIAPGSGRAVVGRVDVVQLATSGGSLRDQLASELARARAAKKVLLVQTTAGWCGACDEIDASLGDARMQSALAGVELVRVDVDEFRSELELQNMWEGSVPWFYRIDSTARPVDAISADEWDDNVPVNMAPVLKAFATGTFTNRRHATQIGTPL